MMVVFADSLQTSPHRFDRPGTDYPSQGDNPRPRLPNLCRKKLSPNGNRACVSVPRNKSGGCVSVCLAGRIIAMAIIQISYAEKFLPTHPELIRDLLWHGPPTPGDRAITWAGQIVPIDVKSLCQIESWHG